MRPRDWFRFEWLIFIILRIIWPCSHTKAYSNAMPAWLTVLRNQLTLTFLIFLISINYGAFLCAYDWMSCFDHNYACQLIGIIGGSFSSYYWMGWYCTRRIRAGALCFDHFYCKGRLCMLTFASRILKFSAFLGLLRHFPVLFSYSTRSLHPHLHIPS